MKTGGEFNSSAFFSLDLILLHVSSGFNVFLFLTVFTVSGGILQPSGELYI